MSKTKQHEHLDKLNGAKSWTARIAYAKDCLPGTEFDRLIISVGDLYRYLEQNPLEKRETYWPGKTIDLNAMNKDHLAAIGFDIARNLTEGNSDFFRRLADAVEVWKNHKPNADKLRLEILKFCIPLDDRFRMRDIIQHLRIKGFKEVTDCKSSEDLKNIRRKVYRICEDLGIAVGAPKKGGHGTRQNRKLKSPR